jgi:hypothetical protein
LNEVGSTRGWNGGTSSSQNIVTLEVVGSLRSTNMLPADHESTLKESEAWLCTGPEVHYVKKTAILIAKALANTTPYFSRHDITNANTCKLTESCVR